MVSQLPRGAEIHSASHNQGRGEGLELGPEVPFQNLYIGHACFPPTEKAITGQGLGGVFPVKTYINWFVFLRPFCQEKCH